MTNTNQPHLVFITAFTAGDEGAIHAYHLDVETGQLQLLNKMMNTENPFFIALSPNRNYLYGIHEPNLFGIGDNGQVSAYKIESPTGRLTLLNRQPTRGSSACYVVVDASGRSLLAANYQNGTVISYPVRSDGSIGEAVSFIEHEGMSINPDRQEGPHAHCFVISPNNQYAYSADLGIDKIVNYRLDVATATLSPNAQPFARTYPGAGPRHFTFHPQQPFAYAINELGNSVTMFDYDPETGTLLEQQTISTIPDDFEGVTHCADLKITPDGRFLYGTNRGHDSLAAYVINEQGRLSLIDIVPSGAAQPQNLAITPDGALLLCANMSGNTVTVFRIHAQTGQLSDTGESITIPMPSCIMIC
ncbi:MAG: lactonase family protein [Chloroflexota bacterium]